MGVRFDELQLAPKGTAGSYAWKLLQHCILKMVELITLAKGDLNVDVFTCQGDECKGNHDRFAFAVLMAIAVAFLCCSSTVWKSSVSGSRVSKAIRSAWQPNTFISDTVGRKQIISCSSWARSS